MIIAMIYEQSYKINHNLNNTITQTFRPCIRPSSVMTQIVCDEVIKSVRYNCLRNTFNDALKHAVRCEVSPWLHQFVTIARGIHLTMHWNHSNFLRYVDEHITFTMQCDRFLIYFVRLVVIRWDQNTEKVSPDQEINCQMPNILN